MNFFIEKNYLLERRAITHPLAPTTEYLLIFSPAGIVFVNPNQAVEAELPRDEVWVLRLGAEYLLEVATRLGVLRAGSHLRFRRPSQAFNDAQLLPLLDQLTAEIEKRGVGWREMMRALVEQIAVNLLRAHLIVQRADEMELSRVGIVDRRLRRAIEFIHDNCGRELSLAEISAAAYLSEFHFARLFKKIVGTTPHHYLAAVRIEKARRLLASTDLPIAEIGAMVGYASQSHFTKVFREATGLPPRAFRDAAEEINRKGRKEHKGIES